MSMAIGMIAEKAMVSENSIELNVVPPSTRCLMAVYYLAMIIIFAIRQRDALRMSPKYIKTDLI